MMEKDIYRVSRFNYIVEETAGYFVSLLVAGAYLAKLTTELGFSDGLTGILSAFVSLGCCFQLFSIKVFGHKRAKKKVTAMFLMSDLFFTFLYVMPLVKMNSAVKSVVFILVLLGGYGVKQLAFAAKTNWFMALIDNKKRGIFTSVKEACSLVTGIVFQLIMGNVVDRLEAAGNTRGVFVVCGLTLFGLAVIHTLSLALSKEKEPAMPEENAKKSGVFKILANKEIRPVIMVSLLWSVCYAISTSFYGTYQIKELGFSMSFVASLAIVSSCSRIPISFALGKYADKKSFADMLKICYLLAAAGFLAVAFSTPATGKYLFPLYIIFSGASMGGINSAQINLIFDYVSPEHRSDVLAVNQAVGGTVAFLATLVTTPLINHIQQNGNTLFGMHIYAQQVVSVLSVIMAIGLIVYIQKVVLKMKRYGE